MLSLLLLLLLRWWWLWWWWRWRLLLRRPLLRVDSAQAHTVRSVVEEYLRGGAASQEAASLRDFNDTARRRFAIDASICPSSACICPSRKAAL